MSLVDSHVRRSAGFMFASRQGTFAIRVTQCYGKELLANRACRSLRTTVALQQNSRRVPAGSLIYQTCCTRQQRHVCCSAAKSSQSELNLILYSKPGCHLCDGLKVQPHLSYTVLHASVSCTCLLPPCRRRYRLCWTGLHLHLLDCQGPFWRCGCQLWDACIGRPLRRQLHLQVRNILDRPEWEQAYGLVIPVLTV